MKKTLGFGVLSVIIGLMLLIFCATDAFSLVFKKFNIDDISYGTIEKGDVAEGDIKFVVTKLGNLEDSRHLFFIPLGKTDTALYLIAANGGYVTIQVREGIDDYDQITAQTAEYLAERAGEPTASHRFLGVAREINDEQLELLKAHFAAVNVSDEAWQYAVSSMVLTEFDLPMTVIELCICFGLVFLGVILMLVSRRYRFGKTVFVDEKVPGEEKAEPEEKSGTEEEADTEEESNTEEKSED